MPDVPASFSKEVAEPAPATFFTLLPVPATVTGGVERVPGKLPFMDGMDLVQGSNYLPPVPGLDRMKPGHSIRNIFNMPAGNLIPGHLFKAECYACNPQPIRGIGTKRHRTRGANNRIASVGCQTVHHTGNTILVRMHPDIGLGCRYPGVLVTGRNTGIKERSHGGVTSWPHRKYLIPYHMWIERGTKVIGKLFADCVPVGFDDRDVSFVIIPDRAGMDPHQI